MLARPLGSWQPLLGEILDPPLLASSRAQLEVTYLAVVKSFDANTAISVNCHNCEKLAIWSL